jgi:hypothetical protein
MSECFRLPLILEVMAPASVSVDMLFYTASSWGFENRDAINKYIWNECCGVVFYVDENHVTAIAIIKRDYTERFVNIIKEALKGLGADVTRLKVRVYDPCKCQV